MTVAASGDLLIHGPVFRRALAYGRGRRYEFRPMLRAIRPLIAGADLALCHLETPLTYGPPRGYPSFRTPVGLGAAIRATGWDACSTASNHTLDGGQRGVNTTLDVLDRFGVRHAGSQDGLIALLDLRVGGSGVRAVRVRYLPTYVRHPDLTVVRARGPSRSRTIKIAGRSRRAVPIR